jgi:hypothetical protein
MRGVLSGLAPAATAITGAIQGGIQGLAWRGAWCDPFTDETNPTTVRFGPQTDPFSAVTTTPTTPDPGLRRQPGRGTVTSEPLGDVPAAGPGWGLGVPLGQQHRSVIRTAALRPIPGPFDQLARRSTVLRPTSWAMSRSRRRGQTNARAR